MSDSKCQLSQPRDFRFGSRAVLQPAIGGHQAGAGHELPVGNTAQFE